MHDSDDAHHNDYADNSPSLPDDVEPTSRESKKAKKEPSVSLTLLLVLGGERGSLTTLCRRPSQWADLEELLDKLLFLAVSGDGKHALYFSMELLTR